MLVNGEINVYVIFLISPMPLFNNNEFPKCITYQCKYTIGQGTYRICLK